MSNERGEFRLSTAAPGSYRVRTLRIGYRPEVSDAITLRVSEELERQIVLSGVAVRLDTVRVAGRNVCRSASDSAAVVFGAWEQVRAALSATQLTGAARYVNATTELYQRTLDPSGRRVLSQTANLSADFVTQPWQSASVVDLRRAGYVVDDATGATLYFAPGLDVLQSEAFVEDHCLRLADKSDRERLGIVFEPTNARRRIPEIRGTIWLDRATSELQRLEFRYVNVLPEQESNSAGEMEFARMKNGAWAVTKWTVQMPVLQRFVQSRDVGGDRVRVMEIRVAGGALALARRGTDTLWARSRTIAEADPAPDTTRRPAFGVLAGFVIEDSTNQPIPLAEVSLPELSKATSANDAGAFRIDSIPPGIHRVLVRRVGYGPADTKLSFAATQPTVRRFALSRAAMLDSVVVTAPERNQLLVEFEENRKRGLGHFLTRAEIARLEGAQLSTLLEGMPGLGLVRASMGNKAWLLSRVVPSMNPYYPEKFEQMAGMRVMCYAQVFLDGTLLNRAIRMDSLNIGAKTGQRATPPFDVNSIPPTQIEAIEFYSTPAQTPARYSGFGAECGVLVIHTRKR